MPVFPKTPETDALWAQFHEADAQEGVATKAMRAVLESGNTGELKAATTRFEAAHDRKMAIYQQLLAFRLDKG